MSQNQTRTDGNGTVSKSSNRVPWRIRYLSKFQRILTLVSKLICGLPNIPVVKSAVCYRAVEVSRQRLGRKRKPVKRSRREGWLCPHQKPSRPEELHLHRYRHRRRTKKEDRDFLCLRLRHRLNNTQSPIKTKLSQRISRSFSRPICRNLILVQNIREAFVSFFGGKSASSSYAEIRQEKFR